MCNVIKDFRIKKKLKKEGEYVDALIEIGKYKIKYDSYAENETFEDLVLSIAGLIKAKRDVEIALAKKK